MRVSDSMMFNLSRSNVTAAREKVAEAQSQVTSGKAVGKPSDDPVAYVQSQRESSEGNRAVRYERTANIALMAFQVADSALGQVTEALQTIKEKALTAANDTINADQRADVSTEVGALRDQIRSLANSQAEGRYVFAGYMDNQAPFTEAGAYRGHSEVRQVEVANGVKLPTGLAGNRVFGTAGGHDVFAAIDALQTALESNNLDGVRASLDAIHQSQNQIIASRTELGAYMDSCDVATTVAQQVQYQTTANQSKLVDVDAFDAASAFARAQQALQIAITVAGQIPIAGLASR
jgi:flagellar hook-associated protein 3 FlgL